MAEQPVERDFPEEVGRALGALVALRDRWDQVADSGEYGPPAIAELAELRRTAWEACGKPVDKIVYEHRQEYIRRRCTPEALHGIVRQYTEKSELYRYERTVISEFIDPDRVDAYLTEARVNLSRKRNQRGYPVPFIDASPVTGYGAAWAIPTKGFGPNSKERMARRQVKYIEAMIMLLANCRQNVMSRLFELSLCMASGTGMRRR